MGSQVFTVESKDKGVQLLQLAKVLPTTVVLDDEDIPDGPEKAHDKLIEQAESDTTVPEVGPEREEAKRAEKTKA